MNVMFRTDASLLIGSGHVMRCLTLADELHKRGADITFICRKFPGNLIEYIEGKGYQVVCMQQTEAVYASVTDDVSNSTWLGVSWQQDASDTISAVVGTQPKWLIVDHYAIDHRWEERLRPHVGNIMVIDDLADRRHDCDLLLDQNLYQRMESRYNNLVRDTCQQLLGPKYALLRPEFAEVRKNLRQRSGEIKRVLVFFGGVDQTNETEKVLNVLSGITNRQFEVDVVVGGGNTHKQQIQNLCADHEGFHYYCQVDIMSSLMAAADLAIGAGGTVTWERCAMGIPSVVTAVAENQKELAETGALRGLLFYLGETRSASADRLLTMMEFSLKFPKTMKYYSANCLELVDARGTNRVVNQLLPPQISVRRATIADLDSVYEWRNAEETRRYIFDAEPIPLETHRDWYLRTLENPNRILLIGEIDNKPVGVMRYDFTGTEALISVYLVPGGQGQGVGTQLIRSGSHWVREHFPQILTINAEIFRENIASLHAFESAGYKEHHLMFQEVL